MFMDNEAIYNNDEALALMLPIANLSSKLEDKYEMIWWAQLAWITAFSIMLVIAIGGNMIVIWIVIAHRRMRSVTNYFLVNLSISDLLMSILNCLFNFIYMVRRDWQFGEAYCKISNFIATVTVAASVFTLTGISCDRYMAIVRPLKPHLSKRKALTSIILFWLFSIILGLPSLLYSAVIVYELTERVRTACVLIWPDGLPTTSRYDFIYQVTIIVTTYFIPMALMICCYFTMAKDLWGSKSIGEMTNRQMESIKSKQKIVRMFIMIVIIFGVCWLPYHSYFIYTHYNREILYSMYVQHVYLGFYWLAMANAMVNPLIYYWMNTRFRKYFNMCLFGWIKYITRQSVKSETDNSIPLSHRYKSSSYKVKQENRKGHMHFCYIHNCKSLHKPIMAASSLSLKKNIKNDVRVLSPKHETVVRHSNSL